MITKNSIFIAIVCVLCVIVAVNSEDIPFEDIKQTIETLNSRNHVMIYSKSYCPYCKRVKALFEELGHRANHLELDQHIHGSQYQAALHKITGVSTVPNVFIHGEHIGGHDDTMALHAQGLLVSKLQKEL